jgi:hypothetical protein
VIVEYWQSIELWLGPLRIMERDSAASSTWPDLARFDVRTLIHPERR